MVDVAVVAVEAVATVEAVEAVTADAEVVEIDPLAAECQPGANRYISSVLLTCLYMTV